MDNKFTQSAESNDNQKENVKSILRYVTDKSRFENEKDSEKKFLGYTPDVIHSKNIDAESDLKGITRILSRSNIDKYQPKNLN